MASHIAFASDCPHWDSDDPDFTLPTVLSSDVKAMIHYGDGRRPYGL
ncbi:MAG: hypothetical protein IT305_22910 [Chloroflexi bacterium]|nr:hypothetical protein [Chloroflexota bacterium]